MKLHFTVKETILKRIDDNLLASYSKNKDKCVFHCCHKWENIYKYALFIDVSGKQYIRDLGLGEDVSCEIPEDVMKGNYFSLSVFGDDSKTTTQENILIQPSGFNDQTEKALNSDESETSSSEPIDDENYRYGCWCNHHSNHFRDPEHLYY